MQNTDAPINLLVNPPLPFVLIDFHRLLSQLTTSNISIAAVSSSIRQNSAAQSRLIQIINI